MPDLSHVSPGDSLRADDWNAIVDALQSDPAASPPTAADAIADAQSLALRLTHRRDPQVLVTLTGSLTGGGQYAARLLRGSSNADGSTNLSLPQGLQTSPTDDILFLNPAETGLSTHVIPTGAYRLGRIVGAASNGRLIVIGDPIPVTLNDLSDVTLASPSDGDILRYDSSDHQWKKLTPITLTVVTDYRVNALTLQKKTRSITILAAGTESAWTTVHTGTTCP